MKNKINLIRIFITIIFGGILYYFQLPALNLKEPKFYLYLFTIFICYSLTSGITLIDVSNIITNAKKANTIFALELLFFFSFINVFVQRQLQQLLCADMYSHF